MIPLNSGLILLNKPHGITSFRVLNRLKRDLNSKKVGHTGTLDKFAQGLMLVLTGKMTKLAHFFSNLDKEYIAVYKFGEQTDTLDPEGSITFTSDIPSLEEINRQIPNFLGNIMQRPPDFSAIHINGQRAYKLAVAGKKTNLKERPVVIKEYSVHEWNPPYLTVKVKCSKGTYIRSLARDLGLATSSRAYVHDLIRTKVGSWEIKDSVAPDNFNANKDILSGKDLFNKINSIKISNVTEIEAEKILNGVPVAKWKNPHLVLPAGNIALFDKNENFIALIENIDGNIAYNFVQDYVL